MFWTVPAVARSLRAKYSNRTVVNGFSVLRINLPHPSPSSEMSRKPWEIENNRSYRVTRSAHVSRVAAGFLSMRFFLPFDWFWLSSWLPPFYWVFCVLQTSQPDAGAEPVNLDPPSSTPVTSLPGWSADPALTEELERDGPHPLIVSPHAGGYWIDAGDANETQRQNSMTSALEKASSGPQRCAKYPARSRRNCQVLPKVLPRPRKSPSSFSIKPLRSVAVPVKFDSCCLSDVSA